MRIALAQIDTVVGDLAGMGHVPGVTVNRYCSSSLQSIRMAAHAIKAGEGDVFIAAGVETVSRYAHGFADSGQPNPVFQDAIFRSMGRAEGGKGTWAPPEGLPDIYIAMGQTAENVAEFVVDDREKIDASECWAIRCCLEFARRIGDKRRGVRSLAFVHDARCRGV